MTLGKLDSNTQKNETGPLSTQLTKFNLKWTKDLSISTEIVKLQEENREKFPDISLDNDFLYMTPKA